MWSTWVLHYEAGTVKWLEHRTRDWKVAGSNPCRSGGRIFFSRVNFLCWLIFWYPFHPRVTAVVRKRPRSLRQKWRWHWQVTAKHAYNYYYYWSLLYSTILRSWADSLHLHVILHEWIAFYSTFLNIHRSGVLTALAWHMNTPYVCGFAWSDMVHGCMVYRERAEMAAVSCGTNHASAVTCKYITSVDIQKHAIKSYSLM